MVRAANAMQQPSRRGWRAIRLGAADWGKANPLRAELASGDVAVCRISSCDTEQPDSTLKRWRHLRPVPLARSQPMCGGLSLLTTGILILP
jgi:hypothetical protein